MINLKISILKNILFFFILFSSNMVVSQTISIKKEWVGVNLEYLNINDSLVTLDDAVSFPKKFPYRLKGKNLKLIQYYSSSKDPSIKEKYFPYQLIKLSQDTLVLKPLNDEARKLVGNRKIFILYSASSMIDKNFQFEKLCFSSTTCYGTCPAMKIEIYKNGKIYFLGEEYTEKYKGLYSGKLKHSQLRDFNNLLKKSAIDKITSRKDKKLDFPTYRLIVYYNGKKKEITTYSFPAYNKKLLDYLLNIYKEIHLKKYKKNYAFEMQ